MRTIGKAGLIPVLALVAAGIAVTAGPQEAAAICKNLVKNGSFEYGGPCGNDHLWGWQHTCNVVPKQTHKPAFGTRFNPTHGDWMAVMSPGGVSDSHLGQDVDIPEQVCGGKLCFWFGLQARDISPFHDWGTDALELHLNGDLVGSVSLNDGWDWCSQTSIRDWTHHCLELPEEVWEPESLSIKFRVENWPCGGGDWGQRMWAYVDAVRICAKPCPPPPPPPIPEPMTAAGLVIAVGALGRYVRRRRA